MGNLLEATDDKLASSAVCILNIHDRFLKDFLEEIYDLADGCHLVVTSVDGDVDHYMKIMLEREGIEFSLCGAVCVIPTSSARHFIECATEIPEVAFYCCTDQPPAEIVKSLSTGYVEYMNQIHRRTELLSVMAGELSQLRARAYVSAGDCNLFIAMTTAFAMTM